MKTAKGIFKFTEMKGFEPLRRLPDLPHFECGPFNHLGTSPYQNPFEQICFTLYCLIFLPSILVFGEYSCFHSYTHPFILTPSFPAQDKFSAVYCRTVCSDKYFKFSRLTFPSLIFCQKLQLFIRNCERYFFLFSRLKRHFTKTF